MKHLQLCHLQLDLFVGASEGTTKDRKVLGVTSGQRKDERRTKALVNEHYHEALGKCC